MPPLGGKAGSELPGPGFRHSHALFSATSNGGCQWLAWTSGGYTQDNAGLPPGGEVRHAGRWGVYAQTRPERNGDAKGQPHLGVRQHHTGEQLLSHLEAALSSAGLSARCTRKPLGANPNQSQNMNVFLSPGC